MNPHQSLGGPGDRVFVSSSNASSRPRARQAGALFQPVTSSEPPATAITDQPDEVVVAVPAPQSGSASAALRWADLRANLVAGTPGAVIALVASAALVLVVAGMTMSTTSSSTESAVAATAPGRLPAPAPPAVGDDHLVPDSPADASAGFVQQAPAQVSSPAAPPAPQQPSPRATRAAQAQPASVRTPDQETVLPPPSSPPPPSTVTANDAGYWTFTPGFHTAKPESPAPGTGPCNCDIPKRNIHNDRDRPSQVDRQRERRAQRAQYRSTSTTPEPGVSEKEEQDRQAVSPDAEAERRPSLN